MTEYAFERYVGVPEEVRAAMRAACEKGSALARKRHPPDDGIMNILFDEDVSGYALQVLFFHDERMLAGPHVIVNAFSKHSEIQGRLAAKVEYTKDDLLALTRLRLETLKAEQARIDAEIKLHEGALALAIGTGTASNVSVATTSADGKFTFHCERCDHTGAVRWPDGKERPCHVCRVEAFERYYHDLTREGRKAERADIVAWLRATYVPRVGPGWEPGTQVTYSIADKIENGEHAGVGGKGRS